jgi:hypothetical protein
MMVVLLDRGADFCLRPKTVEELARLGITNLALVRDGQTVGIVLEGWSFDPLRSAAPACAAVGGDGRTLHPVLQMAVPTAQREGGAR